MSREETIHFISQFGKDKQLETDSVVRMTADALKIDQASYPPYLIIEAAMNYLKYADQHDWILVDLARQPLDREAMIKMWIKQITPKDDK